MSNTVRSFQVPPYCGLLAGIGCHCNHNLCKYSVASTINVIAYHHNQSYLLKLTRNLQRVMFRLHEGWLFNCFTGKLVTFVYLLPFKCHNIIFLLEFVKWGYNDNSLHWESISTPVQHTIQVGHNWFITLPRPSTSVLLFPLRYRTDLSDHSIQVKSAS